MQSDFALSFFFLSGFFAHCLPALSIPNPLPKASVFSQLVQSVNTHPDWSVTYS